MTGSKIVRSLFAAGVFAALAFGAREASADSICYVGYRPTPTTIYGTEGMVFISVYAGPHCTGAFVSTYFFCTAGATSTSCSSLTKFQRQDLQVYLAAILQNGEAGRRVSINTGNCVGGGTNCLRDITFYFHD